MRAFCASALAACLSLSAAIAFGQISAPPPANPGFPAAVQGAQRPGPPPPRDNASTLTGTARLRGRVAAADTGKPLRGAQVWLSAGELRLSRTANTDDDGRYEFTDLPPGRYLITAGKDAYVTLQSGQETGLDPTKTLELADGHIADRIDFSLPRGSVITGRITDEYGDPITHVEVQAMRYQYFPGGRRLIPADTGPTLLTPAGTDYLGQYRIFGLTPGEYLLGATPRQEMFANTGPAAGNTSSVSQYPTTYFPGTISPADAQTIILGSGQEAAAYFSLVPGRMFHVSDC